ncbi:STAS domain-containing protein [Amycolatopsis sp. FDAARGOS 1241]|uniref:STAS domain-containing protein n=1 Tax=Amycolatopsis sp. FDAARGOS 1241 TaxID=2778070 RepID=UPI00195089C5|nr:STAS domain-containing protein [Amycolatopsis sp. FDAARGOS 1241]QRP43308.1 STAS domain-containing protein [Amycolatopsis sp. FDAARGOS 1241]
MTLRSVFLDGELILTVDGVLDGGVARDYRRVTEDAFSHGARRVVVDLTRTTAVDGSGSALLAATAATCISRDVHFILAVPGGVEAEVTDPEQVGLTLGGVETWRDAG